MKKDFYAIRTTRSSHGFTLLETLLSVILLGIIAHGASTLYFSGFRSFDDQADRMVLDSRLRGRMEVLVGTAFALVVNGSEPVNVNGRDYTINWSVVLTDIDGDMTPEPGAKKVTVSVAELPNRSLTTILVDHAGRLGKI